MFRTLALFCAFVMANAILLPLIWNSFIPDTNLTSDPAASTCPHTLVAGGSKVYIDVADLEELALFLSRPGLDGTTLGSSILSKVVCDELEASVYYTLTVENFHLQSDFKLVPIHPYRQITREVFDQWLEEQVDISFSRILKNIGDVNWSRELVERERLSLGAVIASPSKQNPDYFYQWIRDGAITMNTVVNYLVEDGFNNSSIATTVSNYVQNSYELQRVKNPSGSFEDSLLGLGEPKFQVDGTAYTESWGRPQNDGPALRVIAIDNYMKHLNAIIPVTTSSLVYEEVMKSDLEYICRYWKHENFDLWEETNAHHFFTSLVQLKALRIGMRLFRELDDTDRDFGDRLAEEFGNLSHYMLHEAGYLDPTLTHIVETPALLGKRSGLDVAVVIGSLLTHNDDEDSIPFDVSDGLVLNTLSELVKSMKFLYPINGNRVHLNLGVALGRYPEDVYNGNGVSEGNPWFLCTLAGAEMMFKLIADLYLSQNDLVIDASNQHFYFTHVIEPPTTAGFDTRRHNNDVAVALRIPFNSLAFNQTMSNLFQFGDSFLDVVREHVADDGAMSEQFNKYTGFMQGAEELTWSHGSLWSANRWRKRALRYAQS